MEWKWAQA